MKKKLITKLTEKSDNEFILEQIDNIAVSDISNLHSFCSFVYQFYYTISMNDFQAVYKFFAL